MPNSIITTTGLALLARAQREGFTVPINRMIFADITGLNTDLTPEPAQVLPPPAQIVLNTEIGKVGKIDDNTVVYSRILTAGEGNFHFNWIGLYSMQYSTLIAVCYVPRQEKFKTDGFRAGNTMYKNFAIQYANAAKLTAINIPPETWQYHLDDLYAKIDHDHDDKYVSYDELDLEHVAFTNKATHFTELLTAPDTARGNSSSQVINTRSLQKELEDFDVPSKIDFTASRWQLVTDSSDENHGKYRINLITSAADYTHVYKAETYGYQSFEDNVEVRFNSEGYIQLLSVNNFEGFIYTRVKRQLPTYNFSPIRDGGGNITGMVLTGIAANPANVTELHLPSSAEYNGKTYAVLEIGTNAFAGNNNVYRIYVGNGTKIIRSGAFRNMTALVYAYTPDTVEIIEDLVFYQNSKMVDLVLSANLKSFGKWAAAYCGELLLINFSATTEFIGASAVANNGKITAINVDSANQYYKSVNGVLYSKDGKTLLAYPAGKSDTIYNVLDGTEILGEGAFQSNRLVELNLNSSLRRISATALFSSFNLTEVNITALIEYIGDGAFSLCNKLMAINVDNANRYYKSVSGVLYSKNGKTLITYPAGKTDTAYAILEDTERVESSSFYGAKFSSLELAASLKYLGGSAIMNCPNLLEVNITATVESIGHGAINSCPKLTAINVDSTNQYYKSVNGVLYSKDGKILLAYPTGKQEASYTVLEGTELLLYSAVRSNPNLNELLLPNSLIQINNAGIHNINVTILSFGPNTKLLDLNAAGNLKQLETIKFYNPNTVMTGAFPDCPLLLYVHGYPGSTAEAFAKANTLIFVPLT